MSRFVCLLGSPRAGGNSETLANEFCAAAEAAGATVERFALCELQFQGCVNLRHCKTGGTDCGLRDDLMPVLSAVAAADVVVMATPIYFCNLSGLLKQALDRFFSFFVPDYVTADEPSRLGRNKSFVLIQVQGEGPDRYGDLLGQYGPALDKMGFARRELLRACDVRDSGDVLQKPTVLKEARHLARVLARGAA